LSNPASQHSERNDQAGVLPWLPADARAVDLIRVLAMDAVQKAGSGHPGTAMSLAPAVEWFAEQDDSYQQEVLPGHVRARVSVEAGIALGWRGFVGDAGESVSLDHFGESADYQTLYKEFGITADHVVAAAKASLARARAR
jgi:transketolase